MVCEPRFRRQDSFAVTASEVCRGIRRSGGLRAAPPPGRRPPPNPASRTAGELTGTLKGKLALGRALAHPLAFRLNSPHRLGERLSPLRAPDTKLERAVTANAEQPARGSRLVSHPRLSRDCQNPFSSVLRRLAAQPLLGQKTGQRARGQPAPWEHPRARVKGGPPPTALAWCWAPGAGQTGTDVLAVTLLTHTTRPGPPVSHLCARCPHESSLISNPD